MRTYLGLKAPPNGDPISIIDIVMHLGRLRRWGGWADPEYTVLHHTVLVTLLWLAVEFPHDELAWIFCHDLHEFITTDLPGPVKKLIREGCAVRAQGITNLGDPLGDIEKTLDYEIGEALTVEQPPLPGAKDRIHLVDKAAQLLEATLFGPPGSYDDVFMSYSAELRIKVFDVLLVCRSWWHTALVNRQRPIPPWLEGELREASIRRSARDGSAPAKTNGV